LSSYIGTIPTDPRGTSAAPVPYDYFVNTGNSDFILHATLESQNDNIQKDSLQAIPNTFTSSPAVNCYSSGANPKEYCLGSK
jgi:hypothetical protein